MNRCSRVQTQITKKAVLFAGWCLLAWSLGGPPTASLASPRSKIAVFNFTSLNLEASGYGSTITNLLTNALGGAPTISIMDRKELESFLALNDLHQNDDLQNMVHIGSRLGLDFVVAGRVTKNGPAITIDCKAAKVNENRAILHNRIKLLGDAALRTEIENLAKTIQNQVQEAPQKKVQERDGAEGEMKRPLNIVTRTGKCTISLYWETPQGRKAAGYKLYRALVSAGPYIKIAQPVEPQHTDPGLENKTTYYYKIKAYDDRGKESDFSEIVSAQTAPTPEPPIILTAEGHVQSILIVWSPNPIRHPDAKRIKGFRLYRAKEGESSFQRITEVKEGEAASGRASGEIQKIQHMDRGLEDGTVYFYKASTFDEEDLESDFSKPVSGRTIPSVTGVRAEGNMIRENRLAWNAAVSPHVKGYHIYRSKKEDRDFVRIKTIDERQAAAYVDETQLEDDTVYFYRLTLFEEGGLETSPSTTVSARTKGAPPPVLGLKAQSGLVKRVALNWEVNSQEEVTGYKVYRGEAETGTFEEIAVIGGRAQSAYADAGSLMRPLEDNKTYHYRVFTFNKVQVESLKAAYASATTKPRPSKPSGLKAKDNQVKAVHLHWQANEEKDIAHYHIFRKNPGAGNFSRIKELGPETSYLDKGLDDGVEYAYRIQAEDRDELLSDFSDPVSARTKPRPSAPGGLTGTSKAGAVILTWQANKENDVVMYHLHEKGFFGYKKVASVQGTECRVEGISPGKSKSYAVTAVDRDGLESDPSQPLTISGQ